MSAANVPAPAPPRPYGQPAHVGLVDDRRTGRAPWPAVVRRPDGRRPAARARRCRCRAGRPAAGRARAGTTPPSPTGRAAPCSGRSAARRHRRRARTCVPSATSPTHASPSRASGRRSSSTPPSSKHTSVSDDACGGADADRDHVPVASPSQQRVHGERGDRRPSRTRRRARRPCAARATPAHARRPTTRRRRRTASPGRSRPASIARCDPRRQLAERRQRRRHRPHPTARSRARRGRTSASSRSGSPGRTGGSTRRTGAGRRAGRRCSATSSILARQPAEAVDEQLVEHAVLAAEAGVDVHRADAGGGGDAPHGQRLRGPRSPAGRGRRRAGPGACRRVRVALAGVMRSPYRRRCATVMCTVLARCDNTCHRCHDRAHHRSPTAG